MFINVVTTSKINFLGAIEKYFAAKYAVFLLIDTQFRQYNTTEAFYSKKM